MRYFIITNKKQGPHLYVKGHFTQEPRTVVTRALDSHPKVVLVV